MNFASAFDVFLRFFPYLHLHAKFLKREIFFMEMNNERKRKMMVKVWDKEHKGNSLLDFGDANLSKELSTSIEYTLLQIFAVYLL